MYKLTLLLRNKLEKNLIVDLFLYSFDEAEVGRLYAVSLPEKDSCWVFPLEMLRKRCHASQC